jgi:hypothetical protein
MAKYRNLLAKEEIKKYEKVFIKGFEYLNFAKIIPKEAYKDKYNFEEDEEYLYTINRAAIVKVDRTLFDPEMIKKTLENFVDLISPKKSLWKGGGRTPISPIDLMKLLLDYEIVDNEEKAEEIKEYMKKYIKYYPNPMNEGFDYKALYFKLRTVIKNGKTFYKATKGWGYNDDYGG